jgi:hypothetical protein
MADRIEVWDYAAFARHLYEHGVAVVRKPTAEQCVAANFAGMRVVEVSGMAAWHVSVFVGDKRVDIKL